MVKTLDELNKVLADTKSDIVKIKAQASELGDDYYESNSDLYNGLRKYVKKFHTLKVKNVNKNNIYDLVEKVADGIEDEFPVELQGMADMPMKKGQSVLKRVQYFRDKAKLLYDNGGSEGNLEIYYLPTNGHIFIVGSVRKLRNKSSFAVKDTYQAWIELAPKDD